MLWNGAGGEIIGTLFERGSIADDDDGKQVSKYTVHTELNEVQLTGCDSSEIHTQIAIRWVVSNY